jgi:hypothetical protein
MQEDILTTWIIYIKKCLFGRIGEVFYASIQNEYLHYFL